MSSEIIQNVAYDNYNDFQHVNFIFSENNFISLFWGLFNDEIELKVRYTIFNIHSKAFFKKLWCNHVGDHPQEWLAKLGYRLERKVENFKNPTIFWWLVGTYYCLKYDNFRILWLMFNFFHKSPWNELYWIIFCQLKELKCWLVSFNWPSIVMMPMLMSSSCTIRKIFSK